MSFEVTHEVEMGGEVGGKVRLVWADTKKIHKTGTVTTTTTTTKRDPRVYSKEQQSEEVQELKHT